MADQSTKDYLFSKEGRGTLIWIAAFLVFAGLIVWFVIGTLFPGDPIQQAPSAQSQRATGESDVDAADTRSVRPDLTSQNLGEDARLALNEFNQQAEAEGRMGRPTPDDVVLIDVPGLPGTDSGNRRQSAQGLNGECEVVGFTRNGEPVCQGQTGGREIIGYTESGEAIYGQPQARGEIVGYTQDGRPIYGVTEGRIPSNLSREERREMQRQNDSRQQAIIAEHEEYRSRRFTAAVELLNFEGSPASIASVSFDRRERRPSSEAPDPLRISRNEDGTAGVVRGESGSGSSCEAPLVKGGSIRYAQTSIALNTDFEGPVRMTFLEGNLRGYVGMGTFELNELGAKMKLTIDTLFDQDGQRYQVNGYVLDPDTTLWAMSSDVDRHLIYRYGGFGLGAILSSFQTLAENRAQVTEVVTPDGTRSTQNRDPDGKQVTWTVLGEFGEMFEELFRNNINRPITVTLAPGEEAGVLFEDTVCELNTDISKQRRDEAKRQSMGFGDPIL